MTGEITVVTADSAAQANFARFPPSSRQLIEAGALLDLSAAVPVRMPGTSGDVPIGRLSVSLKMR